MAILFAFGFGFGMGVSTGAVPEPGPDGEDGLMLEDGGYIQQENGFFIIL